MERYVSLEDDPNIWGCIHRGTKANITPLIDCNEKQRSILLPKKVQRQLKFESSKKLKWLSLGFFALYTKPYTNQGTGTWKSLTILKLVWFEPTIYSKIEISEFQRLKFELFLDTFSVLEIWGHLYQTDLDRAFCKL